MSTSLEKMDLLEGDENQIRDSLLTVINGRNYIKPLENYGISLDDSERTILLKVAPAIMEQFQVDVTGRYKVQKAENNVWLIPNSTAG